MKLLLRAPFLWIYMGDSLLPRVSQIPSLNQKVQAEDYDEGAYRIRFFFSLTG